MTTYLKNADVRSGDSVNLKAVRVSRDWEMGHYAPYLAGSSTFAMPPAAIDLMGPGFPEITVQGFIDARPYDSETKQGSDTVHVSLAHLNSLFTSTDTTRLWDDMLDSVKVVPVSGHLEYSNDFVWYDSVGAVRPINIGAKFNFTLKFKETK